MHLARFLTTSVWMTLSSLSVYGLENLYGPDIHVKFTYGYDLTPDCVNRQPLVQVNGFWPPPTIHVTAGSEVTVHTTNELLAVAFSIHFHGIDQIGTPWEDGTHAITTCPIVPDSASSVQRFMAPDQPGTYLYHGHVLHAKVAGFTGLLVVEPKPNEGWPADWAHDGGELDLLVADSYHSPALPMAAGLLQQSFRWVGDPQSILMNGYGYFDCSENDVYSCSQVNSKEVCNLASDQTTNVCGAGNRLYYNFLSTCIVESCPANITTLAVESRKTYLMRIGSGSILSLLNVIIQDHTMTVVELDGRPVVPRVITSLDLHAGQRASVLITANQEGGGNSTTPGLFWISAAIRARPGVRYGAALLAYDGADSSIIVPGTENEALLALRALHPAWDDDEYTRTFQQGFEHPEAATKFPSIDQVDKTFVFLNTQERFAEGVVDHSPKSGDAGGVGVGDVVAERPQCFCQKSQGLLRWTLGRKNLHLPKTPVLHQMYYGLWNKSKEENEAHGYYELTLGNTYDIVLQNYPACNGVCETHPWHLHGHHFWHVGTFLGTYDPAVGIPKGDEVNKHYLRDTIILNSLNPPQNTTAESVNQTCREELEPCGYTVIRFTADNPGAWLFHCHIDWHHVMGMGGVFYYGDPPAPDMERTDFCGDVTPQRMLDFAAVSSDGSGNSTASDCPPASASTRMQVMGGGSLAVAAMMTLWILMESV